MARRPVQVLDDGTYLARMNLAGQKGAHPGGVLVRVIEYRVDGGEVVRLLTDLMDPVAFPAGELAALYHQRWVRHEVAWSEWNSQKEDRFMSVT